MENMKSLIPVEIEECKKNIGALNAILCFIEEGIDNSLKTIEPVKAYILHKIVTMDYEIGELNGLDRDFFSNWQGIFSTGKEESESANEQTNTETN